MGTCGAFAANVLSEWLQIKEKFEAAKAHRQRVDDYSLAGALDIYSRYRQVRRVWRVSV